MKPKKRFEDVMRRFILCAALLGCLWTPGCKGPQPDLKLEENMSRVKSILVVPVTNESTKVNAPDYFLSTISKPLAEYGYYVYPVYSVKRLLEDNGLADANLVHEADPKRLGELFGADVILYVQIHNWEAKYVVVKTFTTVQLTYILKDAHSGETIWTYDGEVSQQSGGGSSGNIVADLVASAVEAAMYKAMEESNCLDLARTANQYLMMYPGPGIPVGPYNQPEETQEAAPADTET